MSGTIFKILCIFLTLLPVSAQEHYRFLRLSAGGGIGHFFNTFKNVPHKDVVSNKPSFTLKLLWQPEYRLRIGLETGYYYLYTTHTIEVENQTQVLNADLDVIPIFMSFSMKIIDRLEANFGSGWASMIYVVHPQKTPRDKIVGHVYSMSNYCTGFTYMFPVNEKIDFCAEAKYTYLGKTNDHYVSAMITIAYKIARWKMQSIVHRP